MAEPREPTFAQVAETLLDIVRHDAAVTAFLEPFMARLPQVSPGIADTARKMQTKMEHVAWAREWLSRMAPREVEHRALITGTVK
jgi:hypothetical protein